jgi:negative regulator of replication initiation
MSGRRKDSVYVAAWVDPDVAKVLAERATSLGVSRSEIMRRMLRFAANRALAK